MNGNSIANVAGLTTSGAVTVGGVLNVTGNFTVASTKFSVAAASGNTQVAGALNVLGSTVLSGDLFVGAVITASATTGNITTTGKLTVDGAATFTTTAKVTGATTLSSTLAVTGAATFSSTITAANGTSGSQVVNYGQFPQTAGSFTGLPGVVGSGVGHYLMTGSGTTDGGGLATITFPNSGFPTACSFFHAEPTGNAASTATVAMLRTTPSKTSVDISTLLSGGTGGAAANKTFIWYAFGY